MLIAAMALGVLVGVGEVFGGAAGWVQGAHSYYDNVEWWVVAIIPFGVIAAAGGFCALRKPDFAAALLFLSGIGNFVVGLIAVADYSGAFALFLPTALLVLAGAFALSKQWKRPKED
jgi:uncharacterized membrane protein YdjX (TVP38/TMEM64 family)